MEAKDKMITSISNYVKMKNELARLNGENEILLSCLRSYAYPKNEDGDRAYVFGYEARLALDKIKRHKNETK